jgi:hypothetical protein
LKILHGLGRVIDGGVDGVGMPAIGEVAFRLDARSNRISSVARSRPGTVILPRTAWPSIKSPSGSIRNQVPNSFALVRARHAGAWRAEIDALLDPIGAFMSLGLPS